MERVGDRGYKLSMSEWVRLTGERTREYFNIVDKGGVLVQAQKTEPTGSKGEVKHSMVVIFDGVRSLGMFEGVCHKLNPPIGIPPASSTPPENDN